MFDWGGGGAVKVLMNPDFSSDLTTFLTIIMGVWVGAGVLLGSSSLEWQQSQENEIQELKIYFEFLLIFFSKYNEH